MVENDKNIRFLIERGKQLPQSLVVWLKSISCEVRYNRGRVALRQIVNAKMENCSLEGDAPFKGKWNWTRLWDQAQQTRSLNVVVIGQRNETREAECVFDLLAFQLDGLSRRHRRRPVGTVKIHGDQRDTALPVQGPSQYVEFFRKLGNELKTFFRMIRMAVERNRRPVTSRAGWLVPQ